jgi:hypothetical protein
VKGFGCRPLTEIGLPHGDIPLALFTFNVGVEIGQLIFIGAVLGIMAGIKLMKIRTVFEHHARLAATYAIGCLAAFWFIERLAGFAS